MIKKLRLKLIAVSMLAMFIVLATIITAINIINYNKAVSDADSILSVLEQNEGKFPEPGRRREDFLREEMTGDATSDPSTESRELNISAPRQDLMKDDFRDPFNSPETRYESRFFSILLDENGNATENISMQIAAIDDQGAFEMAEETFTRNKQKGFYENYRFLRAKTDDGYMMIFLDCTRSLGNVRNTLLISILVSLLGLGAVFLLVLIFSRRIVAPVSESYEKQKEFITNAGHEIKTPLSIIAADAEVIEMDTGETEWTADIKSQIKRLTSLTNDLVFLAKMEESVKANVMSDFSLSELTEETVKPFGSRAKTGKITFANDIAENISYNGDKASIEKLISILLDNAVKYTPEGGYIYTSLSGQKNKVVLSVSNTVKDDLIQDDLDHFFDRFYRSDKSRNSKTGGYGIGLSVAKAITERHKGRIRAYAKDKNFLVIEVIL